jgi:membrane fusion protein, multidrug efflux system
MRSTAISLLTSLAFWSACGSGEHHTKATSPAPAIPVETSTVCIQQWPDLYEATGTIRARTAAVVSSKVMAYVREVAVQVGDRVQEGQNLITLESNDLDANVRRAEAAEAEVRNGIPEADNGVAGAKANLDLAQSTFRRMGELAAKRSISEHEFDQASAQLKSAQAAFEIARAKRTQLDSRLAEVAQEFRAARITRDYARISAAFSGVVTARSVEPGNLTAPGAPLLTIEGDGAYRLEASVEESKLPFVKTGQTVQIALEALDRRLTARVSEIVPAVDAAARAYIVKIDLPAMANLRSGMFGRAWFPLGKRQVLVIPPAALVELGQLQSVFVVEDGSAHTRLVTTGNRSRGPQAAAPSVTEPRPGVAAARGGSGWVEVLSGLSEGEKVVSPIPAGLADGARVEVRP